MSRKIITTTSLKASRNASCGIERLPKLPISSATSKELGGSAISSRKGKRTDSPTNLTDQSRKKPKQTDGFAAGRKLACPFFLRDREKHLDCLHFNLKRAKDVKQHIQRKHRSQNFERDALGSDYQRLLTSGATQTDVRLQLGTCSETMSPAQSSKLSMRNSIGQSEEEQWFKMWEILFPDASVTERPSTAYLESDVQEIIKTVRRVWNKKGHAALSSALTSTEGTEARGESADILNQVDSLLNHLSMVTCPETPYSVSTSNTSTEGQPTAADRHPTSSPTWHHSDTSIRYINGRPVRDSWTETNESSTGEGSGGESPYVGNLENMTTWLLGHDEGIYPGYNELHLDQYVHDSSLDSASGSENGSEDMHGL